MHSPPLTQEEVEARVRALVEERDLLRGQLDQQRGIAAEQAAAIDDARHATVQAVSLMHARAKEAADRHQAQQQQLADLEADQQRALDALQTEHQRELTSMELAHALVVAGLQHDLLTLQQRILKHTSQHADAHAAATSANPFEAGSCTHSCASHASASDRHQLLVMLEAQSEALERLMRARENAASSPASTSTAPTAAAAAAASSDSPAQAAVTAEQREQLLQAELTTLQAEMRLMEDIARDERAILARAQEEARELAVTRTALALARGEIDTLQAQLHTAQVMSGELQLKLVALEKHTEETTADNETLAHEAMQQITLLETQLEQAHAKLARVDRRDDMQGDSPDRALELANELEAASQRAKVELQALQAAHSSEVTQLRQALQEHQQTIEALHSQLVEANQLNEQHRGKEMGSEQPPRSAAELAPTPPALESPPAALASTISPESASSLLEFLLIVGRCKSEKRTGWVNERVPLPESVADHMFRMSLMALTCAQHAPHAAPGHSDERIDPSRAVQMALVHDLAEALVGDITPTQFSGVTKADKHQRELDAMRTICDTLRRAHAPAPSPHALPQADSAASAPPASSSIADHVFALWLEYEGGATATARFVKNIDKIDMYLQAYEYQLQANQHAVAAEHAASPDTSDSASDDAGAPLVARLDRFFTSMAETQAKIDSQDQPHEQAKPQRLLRALIDQLQARRALLPHRQSVVA